MVYNNADPSRLIEEVAKELQKEESMKEPDWAKYVKTGHFKERPPVRKDWWYIRAASVLRKIEMLGPVGVSKLRRKYGGKKNRGHKPEHFYRGSGNILRKILQGLEKAGYVKKARKGVHFGRIITGKGVSLLTKSAQKVIKN